MRVPAIIRSGASTWLFRSSIIATATTTTQTAPLGANDFGAPANWDTDQADDATAGR